MEIYFDIIFDMEKKEEHHTTWEEIPSISKEIQTFITTQMKFDKVTKVQKAVIPLFLQNKDVCVKACTGSGKTLAFAVPII